MGVDDRLPVALFSTCPQFDETAGSYRAAVAEVAQWSERAGCQGILVYADHRQLDPWLVAQTVLESTRALSPLVAVQPVYMHPYSVAKMVSSLAHLHGRRVHLNLISGGFKKDLEALDDPTPHDARYARLIEYAAIVQKLLAGGPPLTFQGEFYRVSTLRLTPALPPELRPDFYVSGSSAAGLDAARKLGAVAIKYPGAETLQEWSVDAGAPRSERRGIRVGVIARDTEEEAWRVAHARFPVDRAGQLTHALAMKVSDSVWHRQLSQQAGQADRASESMPWLVPFQNYKTMCPYLVGSRERVGAELARYVAAGVETVILDIPPSAEDLLETRAAVLGAPWSPPPIDTAAIEAARALGVCL